MDIKNTIRRLNNQYKSGLKEGTVNLAIRDAIKVLERIDHDILSGIILEARNDATYLNLKNVSCSPSEYIAKEIVKYLEE